MKDHLTHYLILLSIFAFGIFFFLYFSYNRSIQAWCVVMTSVSYFLWGMVHHYLEKNLYLKVIIEYFLVALLGAGLVISLLFRT